MSGNSSREDKILRGHTDGVTSVSFSPDGSRIVSGSDDCSVQVWDATSGNLVLTISEGKNKVKSVCFSVDGKKILSGTAFDDEMDIMYVCDATSGNLLSNISDDEGLFGVNSLSWYENYIVCAQSNCLVTYIWDDSTNTATSKGYRESNADGEYSMNSVCFSKDGSRIATASNDNTVRVYDNGRLGQQHDGRVGEMDDVEHERVIRTDHVALAVSFSPDGSRIVTGSDDNVVRVRNAVDNSTGNVLLTLNGHTKTVTSVSFSPDGSKIASGSEDNTVCVWDVVSGVCELRLAGHTEPVTSVSFSPDGSKIASGSKDNTVRVWDIRTSDERSKPYQDTDLDDGWSSVNNDSDYWSSDLDVVEDYLQQAGRQLQQAGHQRHDRKRDISHSNHHTPVSDGLLHLRGEFGRVIRVLTVEEQEAKERQETRGIRAIRNRAIRKRAKRNAERKKQRRKERIRKNKFMKKWNGLVRDIESWKHAWGNKTRTIAAVLQNFHFYASSLEKLKAESDTRGYHIDISLYNKLLSWCKEYISDMAARNNGQNVPLRL